MNYIVIAMDGPAGSGKSTVAKLLAEKLGFLYMDTGAMYRAIAYKTLEQRVPIGATDDIITLAKQLLISFNKNDITVNGENVANQIRQPGVNNIVSQIASIPEIRHILIDLQRNIAKDHNVVMEGRDIGSVVFPDASCKFYLEASVEIRAKRRYEEGKEKNPDLSLADIKESIINRDNSDKSRKISPLIKAPDAKEIDTSEMNIIQVVDHLYEIVMTKIT